MHSLPALISTKAVSHSEAKVKVEHISQTRHALESEVKEVEQVNTSIEKLICSGKPWMPPQDSREGRGKLRIGTSGYVYNHWKKVVYPKGVQQKDWFRLYSFLFDTVEINNTFYRLPKSEVFQSWHDQAPPGFCYALKYSRFGTHMKRLKDPEGHVHLFVERVLPLAEFIGPILVQLPPKFEVNTERLKSFLELIPCGQRWAIEVRDPRWLCDDIYQLLSSKNIALCIHDHKDIPFCHPKVVTADWVYLRFHGYDYRNMYTNIELQEHAMWIINQLDKGVNVYAYFNNDTSGYAVFNALTLRDMILKN